MSSKEFLLKNYFNIWWNSEKFNWYEGSWQLCWYHSEYFNIWWDPDNFSYFKSSAELCCKCSKHFNIWWNPDKFNWRFVGQLKEHCYQYKDIWESDYILRKII